MRINKSNLSFSINLTEIIFWTSLVGLLPLFSGLINIVQFIKLIVYFTASNSIGYIVLNKLEVIKKFPSIFNTAINIILGSLLLSFVSFIVNANVLIYIISAFTLVLGLYTNSLKLNINFKHILAISPLFLLLLNAEQTVYATNKSFTYINRDNGFYNAICQSLINNFNIKDFYCYKGLPINYPTLPFQNIAQLCIFTKIPSSVACWGIMAKLIAITAFIPVAQFICLFINFLIEKEINNFNFKESNYFITCCLLLFFAPINIMSLLKFDFAKTIFLGYGYLLPFGSLGFSLSIFFTGLIFLVVYFNNKNYGSLSYVLLFLPLIALSKYAAIVPLGIFLGIYSLYEILNKNYKLILILLFSLPIVALVFYTFTGTNPHFGIFIIETPGQWANETKMIAEKYKITGSLTKQITIALSIGLFFWIGYKLIFIIFLSKFKNENNKLIKKTIVALVITLIVSLLPGLFLNVINCDENNVKLWDVKHDTTQFTRAAIFLITIFSTASALYFFMYYNVNKSNKIIALIAFLWCSINIYSFFKLNLNREINKGDLSWYESVKIEYEKLSSKPKLMSINGTDKFSGTILSCYNIGPWFNTGTTADGDGYCTNLASYKRSINFKKLYDTANLNEQLLVKNTLINEGVDHIVLTIADTFVKKNLIKKNIIEKSDNNWIFKLKN